MKHVFAMAVVAIAVAMVGCQKASDSTRVGAEGPRAGGATTGTIPAGLTLNGVVWRNPSEQSAFQNAVYDFMEAQINPDSVGYVSSQGADQTGVFVAGRVELTSGQPLMVNQLSGLQNILPTSEILVAVYDKFANQTNLPALPVTYLRKANGYLQGNQVFIDFSDDYGHIRLDGVINGQTMVLHFNFQTTRTYDGKSGSSGKLGDLYVPTCQFFRCQ